MAGRREADAARLAELEVALQAAEEKAVREAAQARDLKTQVANLHR